jgi:PII-like signaling protein
MLQKGAAKRVTIYVNEDTQYHLGPLYEAILTFLLHKGVAGATASRAMAGFGAHRLMHTAKIEVLADHFPIRIEFIESAQKVDEVLPTLYDMVADGVIDVQDTTVVKAVMKDGKAEPKQPHEERRGRAKLMRIYMGESDQWNGEPLYQAMVKRLRMMDIAGATVYRGILGYGAKGHTHKQGLLHWSHDLPIMISVVDSEEKLNQALEEIENMMQDGLIVFSDVDIIRLVHSQSLAGASNVSV